MEKSSHGAAAFEADFDRAIVEDDDSAASEMLAAGIPIHISREDTPVGHVIRVHPDGREELIIVDRAAAVEMLNR